MLIWEFELGRIDIKLDVKLLSQYLEITRVINLRQDLHIFAYLNKNSNYKVSLDPILLEHGGGKLLQVKWEDFILVQRIKYQGIFHHQGAIVCN